MNVEAGKPTIRRTRAISALGRIARNGWVSSSAGLLTIKVVNAALGLTTVVLFARLMGSDDYGLYILVLTVSQFFSLPLHMGLPTLLIREIAIGVRQQRLGIVKGIQRFSLMLVGFGSLGLLAVAAGGYLVATGTGLYQPKDGLLPLLILSAATVPVMALLQCTKGALAGFRHVVRSRLPEGILRPALLLAVGGAALWLFDAGPAELVTIYLGSAMAAVLFSVWLVRRAQPAEVGTTTALFESRVWLKSLLPLTGLAAIGMVNSYVDILMLGALRTTSEVAQYRVAYQIGLFPLLFQTIGLAMISPRVAAASAAGDADELCRIVTVGARFIFAGTLGFFLLLLALGGPVIDLAFGAEYAGAFGVAIVLSAGALVSTMCGPTTTVLNMTRNEGLTARVAFVAAVVNVVLNGALIPFFGPLGAAMATAIATSVLQISAWRAARKATGHRTDIFAPSRPRSATA